ncbi:prolyl oligopeptidase family serine peptidase [Brevundimonas sp. M20]|uniref:prolyl oligopeptidase family serine peptidase n=1 Tax=Brevundimonas sp. M20 TaxID=2591463 RepID=UPI001146BD08|nr:prolyl oligopeptidase family serine peptidase [Brevundimonas sp. M20]QDH72843.1 prolyl oligopeptidase family serine peptidase [Brevundimonas sp. M20]
MRHRLLARALPAFVLLAAVAGPAMAQEALTYQQPPSPIADILDTKPTPSSSLSPNRTTLALFDRSNLPPIAELAEPMLRLGGYRINPRNNGQANSRVSWLTGLSFQPVAGGEARAVQLPANARFLSPSWSPDGSKVALLMDAPTGLELWVVDVATARASKLTEARVNAATGSAFDWTPDSAGLVVRLTPQGRGAAPDVSRPPAGPIVAESMGRVAPARTYQDLLSDAGDEALFDHYFTSQLTYVPINGRGARDLGAPAVYLGASVSPDGRHVLTTTVKRPYSYVVPAGLFPSETRVIDLQGRAVHQVADLPLRDNVPTPFDAVAPGPRSIQWRADAPATLVWTEAQDGGDPRTPSEVRDRVFMLAAPFNAQPTTLIDLNERYGGITWGDADTALVTSRWFNTRHETRYVIDPSNPGTGRVLLERNYQDQYNNPGSPLTEPNAQGFNVARFAADGRLLMTGPGATREGEYPFLAAMDLNTGQSERLWTSATGEYESIVGVLDDGARRLVTRRETKNDPANLFVRDLNAATTTPLTHFTDPAPQLAGVSRQLITYTRADGVQLSGTLYLPAGYDKDRDGPLPLVMWAYPAEFTDAAVAGQVVDTANRFVRPGGSSHLFLLTQGYAVLDDPSMPIIGKDGAEPNDTYIEQLTASAEAAVNAVVELGVADRDRIAVGGHSYGAFMTANLLAHTDLFRTGIARSGAYNRTLTPFGFQAEQRTYWEAPETYNEMSPFAFANRVNEPILLIHGEADDNSGTFPVQSERFYAALKGNGAQVRYVVLPLEAHGYRARESVGHTLWETVRWLDQYVKNAPPRAAE